MIYWLVDNSTLVLIVLGIALLAVAFLWWQQRTRPLLIATGSMAAAMVVVFLLSLFVETDQQRLAKTLNAMAEAWNARRFDGVMKHVADPVEREVGGDLTVPMSKAKLEELARRQAHLRPDLQIETVSMDVEKVEPPIAVLVYRFRVKGENLPVKAKLTFTMNAERRWLVTRFGIYYGLADTLYTTPQ